MYGGRGALLNLDHCFCAVEVKHALQVVGYKPAIRQGMARSCIWENESDSTACQISQDLTN